MIHLFCCCSCCCFVIFLLQVKRQTQQFLFVELLMVNDNRQVCSFLLPLPSSYLPPPHLLPPLPSHALSSLSPLPPIFLQSLHSNHVTYVFPQYINMGSDLTATVNRDLVIVNTMDTVRRSLANTHSKSYFYLPPCFFSLSSLFSFSPPLIVPLFLSLFLLHFSPLPPFFLFFPCPSFYHLPSFLCFLSFPSLPPSLLFSFLSLSLSLFFLLFPPPNSLEVYSYTIHHIQQEDHRD